MSIRGWVYVLSHKAMPGLVKVGYSTKDPVLRVEELSGSGLPYAFVLEYDVLVVEPRDVEQKVHELLSKLREGKEFFRADVKAAVSAIQEIIRRDGKSILLEQRYAARSESAHTLSWACRACGAPVARYQDRCTKCFASLQQYS